MVTSTPLPLPLPFKRLSDDDMVAPIEELRRFGLERVPGVQRTLEVTAHRIEPVDRNPVSPNGRYSTSSWKNSRDPFEIAAGYRGVQQPRSAQGPPGGIALREHPVIAGLREGAHRS